MFYSKFLEYFLLFSVFLLFATVSAHRNHQYNQQQQQPPQQQQQQQQQQQPAQQGGHQDSFLDHADREHIAHDVKDQYYVDIDKEKVPESEMDFYNFKLHDIDSNFLLDGIELIAAMNHDRPETKEINEESRGSAWAQNTGQTKIDSDAMIIDHILLEYDQDKDGYISFGEFKRVRASIHS